MKKMYIKESQKIIQATTNPNWSLQHTEVDFRNRDNFISREELNN